MRHEFLSRLLTNNQFRIYEYLNTLSNDSHFQTMRAMELDEFPVETLQVADCFVRGLGNSYFAFLDRLLGNSFIFTCLGKRGSGKTAFLVGLAEFYHSQGVFVCGYNVSSELPDWFHVLEFNDKDPYGNLPLNCFCLHDECHLDVDSKNWQSKANNKIRKFISTTRHRHQSIAFTSQLASNISLDLVKYADVKLFKGMNRSNDDVDRANFLRRFSLFYPERKNEFLADIDGELYFGRNPLPSFFSSRISEAFR